MKINKTKYETIAGSIGATECFKMFYSHDLSHGVDLFVLRNNIHWQISLVISRRHGDIEHPVFVLFGVWEIILSVIPASVSDIFFNILVNFRIISPVIRSMMMATSEATDGLSLQCLCAMQISQFWKQHLSSIQIVFFIIFLFLFFSHLIDPLIH